MFFKAFCYSYLLNASDLAFSLSSSPDDDEELFELPLLESAFFIFSTFLGPLRISYWSESDELDEDSSCSLEERYY
jgi:hypothetical protein